jgi:Domain of unknown function (DUF4258)
MRRSWIERIREQIRLRRYDMTFHAMEEMAEDNMTIGDIEHAVVTGRVVKIQKGDPKGDRYVVEGMAADNSTLVGVVGRFPVAARYLIITVYRIEVN